MELEVYNISGKKTDKKVKLNKSIFGITPNDHAIYLDTKHYMASQRQGTHKTKQRAEIVGSTRKIKRQKGTGTARAGNIKSPIFRGGGRVFGPQPRDYSFKLNKKLKKLARRSALTYKAKEKGITIIEDFKFEAPKTKEYLNILANLNVSDKKTLLVLPEVDINVILSSRNLQKTKVVLAESLNTYDILNANNLLIAEGSMEKIEKILA